MTCSNSLDNAFFLKEDKEAFELLRDYSRRAKNTISLIASESELWPTVYEAYAYGRPLINETSSDFVGSKYHRIHPEVEAIEELAIERAKNLFHAKYANVQPFNCTTANIATYAALTNPDDKVLSFGIKEGGHISHTERGLPGRWLKFSYYGVDQETFKLDYSEIQRQAEEVKPKVISIGPSAYSLKIDYRRFREIADSVNAYLFADISHYSGLVAGGNFPSPVPHAHVVTMNTYMTLSGGKGGLILSGEDYEKKIKMEIWGKMKNELLWKALNYAVHPITQSPPDYLSIFARAVLFKMAMSDKFKEYTKQVVKNARTLSNVLTKNKLKVVGGGTDSHLVTVDLREIVGKEITGFIVDDALYKTGIKANKEVVPYDPRSGLITSGVRFGSQKITRRGMKENEVKKIGEVITNVINSILPVNETKYKIDKRTVKKCKKEIESLAKEYPLPILS